MMLDFAELRRILPHGPGMVLLDGVEELLPGVRLVAIKTISGVEPCYAGLDARSSSRAYAYPPSLLLESFGQAAAVLWLRSLSSPTEQVLMLAAARTCVFHGHAFPGDVVHHVVELEHCTDDAAFVSGRTTVGSRLIASYGSLAAVVRPRGALPAPVGAGLSTTHTEGVRR
jgi:3-hydroxyacyl-[acyl-carrier-protein] dehydratase